MSCSPSSSHSFESIEQLDEAMHSMGWAAEYRQLNAGPFSSKIKILEGSSWFLLEEQSSRRLEVEAPAPEGMTVLALVEGDPAVVNGQILTSSHILLLAHQSELRATLPAGIKITQLGIEAERFEAVTRTIAPGLQFPCERTTVIPTGAGHLANVLQAMKVVLSAPPHRKATREETASAVLSSILAVADNHGKKSFDRSLHGACARRALNRAREYIEANLERQIRIVPLCDHAGTTLRSLERSFTRELGVSPQQYVKARRLHAVRQRLLASDKEQGLSVTEIAVSHGFSHLGRFAGDYHRHFGEYPRETLCN